ncbi:MAG: hypothetical protein H6553_07810 [Chitinophagales bacterium]|nr:hypothetical protein [Chitinophagales bacterium]
MKNKTILFFILAILSTCTFAFDDDFYISLKKETVNLKNNNYKVVDIIDARTNKKNIGFIQSLKVNADFLKPFDQEIKTFLESNLTNKGVYIILYVNEFKIYESKNSNNEATANCNLDIDFYITDGFDIYKILHSNKTNSTTGKKPSKLFETTIATTFQQCFDEFSAIDVANIKQFPKYDNIAAIAQSKDTIQYNFAIFNETIKDGIYTSYEALKNNQPTITTGYTLESLPRTHQLWNDTYDFNLKFEDKESKVKLKNICAIAINNKVFVLYQNEFFELHIDNNKLYFYAYDNVNASGAIIGSAIGGFFVGAIASEIQLKKAKDKKVKYFVNPTNGKITDTFVVEEIK